MDKQLLKTAIEAIEQQVTTSDATPSDEMTVPPPANQPAPVKADAGKADTDKTEVVNAEPARKQVIPVEPAQKAEAAAPEQHVIQQIVNFKVEPQNADPRSLQFQCVVTVENGGPKRVQIISLRSLIPAGATEQQVFDTSNYKRRELEQIYADLSNLLSLFLFKESQGFRNSIIDVARSALKDITSGSFTLRVWDLLLHNTVLDALRRGLDQQRAWSVTIRNSRQAQAYYAKFLAPREQEQENGDFCGLFQAKIADALLLEQEFGDLPLDEVVTEVEPGTSFVRMYVYNCERQYLIPRAYTFAFDCAYRIATDTAEAPTASIKHRGGSIATTIAPKPFILTIISILSSLLGALLKLAMDAKLPNEIFSVSGLAALPLQPFVAAMITALFFFNIYDATEIGKKINVGAGWRSALLIGGLSGLLNEKVVAALQSLLG
jgi:hypothetical protein